MYDLNLGQSERCVTVLLDASIGRELCQKTLQAWGFQVSDPDEELRVNITLPAKWRLLITRDGRWGDVVDSCGKTRGLIFRQTPHLNTLALIGRYTVSAHIPSDPDGNPTCAGNYKHHLVAVTDDGDVLHRIGVALITDSLTKDKLAKQGFAWLDQHYPDWKNVTAYWET